MQQFLVISLLIIIGFVVIRFHRLYIYKKTKKILKDRSKDNYASFLNHFKEYSIQEKILKSVYEILSKSTLAEEMPVLPNDDLIKDWGFEDDYEDLIIDLYKMLDIPNDINLKDKIKPLKTVEDLVFYLSSVMKNITQ